ncbi:MAG TPA: helix-turn-helix domain-containing protein [Thermoanaerobaculia bacterium]|nr:helix-turn-helix domain-containing protein [Thermoanaerobaculia bacterium]
MITVDLLSLLCVAGAAQLFVMAVVFSTSRSLSQRLFAMFAANLGVIIAGSVVMDAIPPLARVHLPFNYLLSPLFYLFVRATLTGEIGSRPWMHAIPAAGCAVALVLSHPARVMLLGVIVVQAALYLAATLRVLMRHDRADRTLWISQWTFVAIWLGAVARLAGAISPRVIPSLLAFGALLITAALLRGRVAEKKYVRSTLTDERSEAILRKLLAHFNDDKPYLDPELTVDALAQRLAVPSKHLSQIINDQLGRNFNDWINAWRVEEAKRRLIDQRSSHLSIVAIAEAAGFRSKSTFNAAFRKETSTTPSAYRRQCPN